MVLIPLFLPRAYLQFGPFLDAKHEQVEVSDRDWEGEVPDTCIQLSPHYFHIWGFVLHL